MDAAEQIIATLIDEHVRPLARQHAGNGLEVADLVTVGYMAIKGALPRYQKRPGVRAWSYFRPFVLGAFTQERRRMAILPRHHEHVSLEGLTAPENNDAAEALAEVLEHALPDPIDRQLIIERWVNDCPLESIAKRAALSLAETKRRLADAMATLTTFPLAHELRNAS